MKAFMLEMLKEAAMDAGIPTCGQTSCGLVGTHIAAWVTGDVVGCQEHSEAFVRLGALMGVNNVTVRRNPDAPFPPVPSKRFLKIGQSLADEVQ